MGEMWHRRVKRFDKAQKERLASPDVKRSRKWPWIILVIILVLFFHFVLHVG